MSHHSNQPYIPPINEKLEEELKVLQKRLHGEFPNGRLNKEDDGALAVMVGHEMGKVVIQFPHPTAWIGFTPEQAMDIAQLLISHAREAGLVGVYTIKL